VKQNFTGRASIFGSVVMPELYSKTFGNWGEPVTTLG